jgi:hypothetical protein
MLFYKYLSRKNETPPFKKAIVLTLKRRPDKIKNTLKEVKKAKIKDIEVVYGIDGLTDIKDC